jgi:hypothetical protein
MTGTASQSGWEVAVRFVAFGICLGAISWSALVGGMAGTLWISNVDYGSVAMATILIGLGGVAGMAVRRALIRRIRARGGAPPR